MELVNYVTNTPQNTNKTILKQLVNDEKNKAVYESVEELKKSGGIGYVESHEVSCGFPTESEDDILFFGHTYRWCSNKIPTLEELKAANIVLKANVAPPNNQSGQVEYVLQFMETNFANSALCSTLWREPDTGFTFGIAVAYEIGTHTIVYQGYSASVEILRKGLYIMKPDGFLKCAECDGTGVIEVSEWISCDTCNGSGNAEVSEWVSCNICGGLGQESCTTCVDDESGETCPDCGGVGYVNCSTCGGSRGSDETNLQTCPDCGGSGGSDELTQKTCPSCDGTGFKFASFLFTIAWTTVKTIDQKYLPSVYEVVKLADYGLQAIHQSTGDVAFIDKVSQVIRNGKIPLLVMETADGLTKHAVPSGYEWAEDVLWGFAITTSGLDSTNSIALLQILFARYNGAAVVFVSA